MTNSVTRLLAEYMEGRGYREPRVCSVVIDGEWRAFPYRGRTPTLILAANMRAAGVTRVALRFAETNVTADFAIAELCASVGIRAHGEVVEIVGQQHGPWSHPHAAKLLTRGYTTCSTACAPDDFYELDRQQRLAFLWLYSSAPRPLSDAWGPFS
jgi:hypothetical protein